MSVQKLDQALRTLHKALIDALRQEYELTHAAVSGPRELFDLVARDPFFAWLHPLSQAMVEVEDMAARPASPAELQALRRKIMALVAVEGEPAQGFAVEYFYWLQRNVDVAMAHAPVRQALRDLS